MSASTIILAVLAILFVYWFRYTCLLILSARTARDYSRAVAQANGLCFTKVRNLLEDSPAPVSTMDAFQASLDRDYRLVTYLLRHAATCRPEEHSFQEWMLRLDYRLMRIAYAAVRRVSPSSARKVLLEMTTVITHLANTIGERLQAPVAA